MCHFAMIPLLRSWSLGMANTHLSYYDGLIKLTYTNGSQYNDEQHTMRSTLISFLCNPEAGNGQPEFQVTRLILSVVQLIALLILFSPPPANKPL